MMGGQGAAAEYVRPQSQVSTPTRQVERERETPPHIRQSGNEGSYSDRGMTQSVSYLTFDIVML